MMSGFASSSAEISTPSHAAIPVFATEIDSMGDKVVTVLDTCVFQSGRSPSVFLVHQSGMTPFFRPITYESRLAASIGWQEDYNYDEQKKKTALPGANSSQNPGS